MNNEFFKLCAKTMDKIERESAGKIYLLNVGVSEKAARLYEDFYKKYENAEIEYDTAYRQIRVTADTYVWDVRGQERDNVYYADIVSIDSTNDGMLHVECVFKNAFETVGETVEG